MKTLLTPSQKPLPINTSRTAPLPRSCRTKLLKQWFVYHRLEKGQTAPIFAQERRLCLPLCTPLLLSFVVVEHHGPRSYIGRTYDGGNREFDRWDGRDFSGIRGLERDDWFDRLAECRGLDNRVMLGALKAELGQINFVYSLCVLTMQQLRFLLLGVMLTAT